MEENKQNLKEEENIDIIDIKEKKVKVSKYEKVLNENEELKKVVENWKNKYYSVYSDTENLRKSIEKDHREALKYRSEGFIDKLMPALDGFHMALSMEIKNEEMKNFIQGFSYIYQNIMSALESEGVSELAPKIGEKFDLNTMHALDTVESEGEENLIVKVYANGFKLHDRIIRPAMVYVSKKKVETKEIKEDDNIQKEECDA